jgi:hypothetical protein
MICCAGEGADASSRFAALVSFAGGEAIAAEPNVVTPAFDTFIGLAFRVLSRRQHYQGAA